MLGAILGRQPSMLVLPRCTTSKWPQAPAEGVDATQPLAALLWARLRRFGRVLGYTLRHDHRSRVGRLRGVCSRSRLRALAGSGLLPMPLRQQCRSEVRDARQFVACRRKHWIGGHLFLRPGTQIAGVSSTAGSSRRSGEVHAVSKHPRTILGLRLGRDGRRRAHSGPSGACRRSGLIC